MYLVSPAAFSTQVEFSEAHISAVQEDRRILLEEANSHRSVLFQRLETSGARLAESETALRETAKNLILGVTRCSVFWQSS